MDLKHSPVPSITTATVPSPGLKNGGNWDLRPHRSRLIHVDARRLDEWNSFPSDTSPLSDQAPLLYPVTSEEEGAISALASALKDA